MRCICIYMYIYRERERDRETERASTIAIEGIWDHTLGNSEVSCFGTLAESDSMLSFSGDLGRNLSRTFPGVYLMRTPAWDQVIAWGYRAGLTYESAI